MTSLFIAGSFFVLGAKADAATKYISTSGSDVTGDGSQDIPWATLDYALTGNRLSGGDTLYMQPGTYDSFNGSHTYITPAVNVGDGNPVYIKANGGLVTHNIPINTTIALIQAMPTNGVRLEFDGINFSNPNSVSAALCRATGGVQKVTFKNATIDMNGVVLYVIQVGGSSLPGPSVILDNITAKNPINSVNNNFIHVSYNNPDGMPEIKVLNSTIDSCHYFVRTNYPINLTMHNNTFKNGVASSGNYIADSGHKISIKYNTIILDSTFVNLIQSNVALHRDAVNNPSNYVYEWNIFWKPSGSVSSGDLNSATGVWLSATNHNYFIDPDSDNAVRVKSEQIPIFVKDESKMAGLGDSIMSGTAGTLGNRYFEKFQTLTGILPCADQYCALGGLRIQGALLQIDRMMAVHGPSKVIFAIGVNNMNISSGLDPSDGTATDWSAGIIAVMQKLIDYGVTPIWLGVESNMGNPPDTTQNDAINATVGEWCLAHGIKYGSILDYMRTLHPTDWGTYYYTPSIANEVHPNNAGHNLMAELAAYLYYNNYAIGTDKIDIGAGARIYKDGKFRNLITTSGIVADLSVTSQDSGFISGDYSVWMDITDISWFTTGTRKKTWTESSTISGLTNTAHTVGDLEANKYYEVKVDNTLGENITGADCISGICKANSQGKITFTYTGNYSTHTFTVEEKTTSSAEAEKPKIEIKDKDDKKVKKDETTKTKEEKITLKGKDQDLSNGVVKIYKNNKLWKTITASADGIWEKTLKFKENFSGWIKVRQYDKYGILLSTDKTKIEVDSEKPKFTSFNLPWRAKRELTKLNFPAKDNEKIEKYKIYVGGKIYQTKYSTWSLPREAPTGLQRIKIRAYDEVGNTVAEEKFVWVK